MARIYLIFFVVLSLLAAVVLSFLPENWWKHLPKKNDMTPFKLALWERSRYIRRCRNAFLTGAIFFIGTAAGLILSDRFNSGPASGTSLFFLFSLGFPVLTGLSVIAGFYYLVLALKNPSAKETGLPPFLIDAPGPFPWYLSRKPVIYPSKKEELFWDFLTLKTASEPSAGILKSLTGEVYGLILSGAYVKPGPRSQFLIWDQGITTSEGAEREMVRLKVIDAGRLLPVTDIESALKEMEATGSRNWFPGGEVGAIVVPTTLSEGIYSREFPSTFHEFGELILFVTSASQGGGWRKKEELKLWIIYPAVGTLEVISQEWYGESPFARGKQVPVRASRDPATGAICCEVIRMGVFSLNESKKKIGEFIIDDRHYAPQGILAQKKPVKSALQ